MTLTYNNFNNILNISGILLDNVSIISETNSVLLHCILIVLVFSFSLVLNTTVINSEFDEEGKVLYSGDFQNMIARKTQDTTKEFNKRKRHREKSKKYIL